MWAKVIAAPLVAACDAMPAAGSEVAGNQQWNEGVNGSVLAQKNNHRKRRCGGCAKKIYYRTID